MKTKKYERSCPKCNKKLFYKRQSALILANKRNSVCKNCSGTNEKRKLSSSFGRVCPRCNHNIYYTLKGSLNRANKLNSFCKDCSKLKTISYNENHKWCNKCKLNQPKSSFYKNNHNKNNLTGYCKNCTSKDNKQHRANDIKKYKTKAKVYYELNRVKRNNSSKEWYNNNKEYSRIKSKEWRKNNKERARYLDRKSDRIRRALKRELNDNHYSLNEEKISFFQFNNKCYNCNNINDLTVDHHRALSKGHPLTLFNAVILCRSCNSSKGAKSPEDFYGKEKCEKLNQKLKKIALTYTK